MSSNQGGPLYLFYELRNFYQNHRQYVLSRDPFQLQGRVSDLKFILYLNVFLTSLLGGAVCVPIGQLGPSHINRKSHLEPLWPDRQLILQRYIFPALSFKSDGLRYLLDVFALDIQSSKPGIFINEAGISLASDRQWKFHQPDGFVYSANPSGQNCDSLLGKANAKAYQDSGGEDYCFWYPYDETTQYLYETYPQISPINGVTDEHFIVWMRTATQPTFRKLYGVIDGPFNVGDVIAINVTANFEVRSFGGSKAMVLSSQGEYGQRNNNLGMTYIVIGALSLAIGIVLLTVNRVRPRKYGDSSFLPSAWLEVPHSLGS